MNTGQTMITIAAFIFLGTMLNNFYSTVAATSDDIAGGQDGILATTISTSYMELAQGLAFDEVTDSSDVAILNVTALTAVSNLGPDASSEDSVDTFNDFDDFAGKVFEKTAGGTNRRFKTRFEVHYVNPDNIATISSSRTFVKRMDLTTWRSFPPPSVTEPLDSVRMSLVLGYFHFD